MPTTFEFSKEATKRNGKAMKEALSDPETFADKLHPIWESGVEKGKRRVK
jgi:hypothetical protein